MECQNPYKNVHNRGSQRPEDWDQVSAERGAWARKSLLKALHGHCSAECYPERRKLSTTELIVHDGPFKGKPTRKAGNPGLTW